MLILEGTRQAGSPTDTTVSTEHVHYGRTTLKSSEQVGAGSEVSGLIATPAVSAGTDLLLVDITRVDHVLHTGEHAVVAALTGIAIPVMDVWIEDYITVAIIIMVVDGRAVRLRHTVVVQCLGVLLIEVDDQRILLVWIEISRFVDNALHFAAIQLDERDQLGRTPCELTLLGDAISQFHRLLEGRR